MTPCVLVILMMQCVFSQSVGGDPVIHCNRNDTTPAVDRNKTENEKQDTVMCV